MKKKRENKRKMKEDVTEELKRMSVKDRESEKMEEVMSDDEFEIEMMKEKRALRIEKWREERERKAKEERLENMKKKTLIIKRGEKANEKCIWKDG